MPTSTAGLIAGLRGGGSHILLGFSAPCLPVVLHKEILGPATFDPHSFLGNSSVVYPVCSGTLTLFNPSPASPLASESPLQGLKPFCKIILLPHLSLSPSDRWEWLWGGDGL